MNKKLQISLGCLSAAIAIAAPIATVVSCGKTETQTQAKININLSQTSLLATTKTSDLSQTGIDSFITEASKEDNIKKYSKELKNLKTDGKIELTLSYKDVNFIIDVQIKKLENLTSIDEGKKNKSVLVNANKLTIMDKAGKDIDTKTMPKVSELKKYTKNYVQALLLASKVDLTKETNLTKAIEDIIKGI